MSLMQKDNDCMIGAIKTIFGVLCCCADSLSGERGWVPIINNRDSILLNVHKVVPEGPHLCAYFGPTHRYCLLRKQDPYQYLTDYEHLYYLTLNKSDGVRHFGRVNFVVSPTGDTVVGFTEIATLEGEYGCFDTILSVTVSNGYTNITFNTETDAAQHFVVDKCNRLASFIPKDN